MLQSKDITFREIIGIDKPEGRIPLLDQVNEEEDLVESMILQNIPMNS